ncbi:nucleoprotein-like protein [Bufonid herpesvirus 1]|uniref:nucleoprotein-like protein n=1 Tax=Bufonid herpesvirus 1 TaxID=2282206 RepID=UPI000EB66059|nr:nucleoprotein-like protein [Bufonid herpesvirus 1]AXF48516.1 nucleoprotein-like protein [Bufonid herpesvirus 1]
MGNRASRRTHRSPNSPWTSMLHMNDFSLSDQTQGQDRPTRRQSQDWSNVSRIQHNQRLARSFTRIPEVRIEPPETQPRPQHTLPTGLQDRASRSPPSHRSLSHNINRVVQSPLPVSRNANSRHPISRNPRVGSTQQPTPNHERAPVLELRAAHHQVPIPNPLNTVMGPVFNSHASDTHATSLTTMTASFQDVALAAFNHFGLEHLGPFYGGGQAYRMAKNSEGD